MPKEPKIKASSTVIDITGLPPGLTWTQEGDTITFSEPIFMEKIIKELLKELGETNAIISHGQEVPIKHLSVFQQIKYRIKSLRNENKRLKKENLELMASLVNKDSSVITEMLREQRNLLRKELETPKPVAEFKCAKTNKPEKDGDYTH